MVKFLLLLLTSIFILSGCHGCSFIKEKFGMTEASKETQQNEQQPQEQQERKAEPIPVSPQHS